jgi:hypothetical protein
MKTVVSDPEDGRRKRQIIADRILHFRKNIQMAGFNGYKVAYSTADGGGSFMVRVDRGRRYLHIHLIKSMKVTMACSGVAGNI